MWQLPSNLRDGVLFASPASNEERASTANACVRKLGIELPALLDGVENAVEQAYTAWPDRIYLIETGGRVAFKSAPGPFGFSTASLKEALDRATRI